MTFKYNAFIPMSHEDVDVLFTETFCLLWPFICAHNSFAHIS